MESQESFVIEGLAGERKLAGEIKVGGAKNAVLKTLAGAVLFADEVSLDRVPEIEDVARMCEALSDLGAKVEKGEAGKYKIKTDGFNSSVITPAIAKRMRSSIVLSGPLLARFGSVSFPFPGGCVIGKRPIDIFLEAFKKMGAEIKEEDNNFTVTASGGKLHGAEIFLRLPSVTATETLMMAGVLATGTTVLKNVALEPEIKSLGEFLNTCGAKIEGLGTPVITIEGGELLLGTGKTYVTMPDRIEAGSFVIMAALTAKDLKITDCDPSQMDALLESLISAGVNMEIGKDYVRVSGNEGKTFLPVEIKTHEYPGFVTDLQAPMSIFLTQATGQSYIFETIYENRLNYLETISRFGAKVRVLDSHRALIDGPEALSGKEVESPDLRAGLAYVIAGLIASGQTIVHNVYYIDRGYEKLDERLRAIGAKITRVPKEA